MSALLSLLTRFRLGHPDHDLRQHDFRPRKEHELDGPQEVHLVLLDNGRSQAFADSELRQTLNCIRCGACMIIARSIRELAAIPIGRSTPALSARSSPSHGRPGQGSRPPERVIAVRCLW